MLDFAWIISIQIACDWNNSQQNFTVPVYGILCNKSSFQFFLFDGSTKSLSFFRGAFPGDPLLLRWGLELPNFIKTENACPFIRSLRTICETVFDLLLRGYISSVGAYRDRSAKRSSEQSKPSKNLDKWDEALKSANEALGKFRDADVKRQNKDRAGAKEHVQEALIALKFR